MSERSDKVADPIEQSVEEKVTTKKAKDPKRVEMGKKLAELSKAARERKAKQKRDAEAAADSVVSVPTEINYGYLIGTVALLATIGSLYYARMTYNRKALPLRKYAVGTHFVFRSDRVHRRTKRKRKWGDS